jgi:hypothetical protein
VAINGQENAILMVLWYNGIVRGGHPEWGGRMVRAAFPANGEAGFHANHSAAPVVFRKDSIMTIRQKLRDYKNAPEQAIKVSVVALAIAIAAFILAILGVTKLWLK